MEEILHFCSPGLRTHQPLVPQSAPVLRSRRSSNRRLPLHRPMAIHVSLPHKPAQAPAVLPPLPDPFRDKVLFLDSIGIDLFAATAAHPPILSSSLSDLRSTVDFLLSMGISSAALRRVCGMCPEVLAASPKALTPVFTFLLREARVEAQDLLRIINRRPRLLVSDVDTRLRPTLYFLQMLGVSDIPRHATLLSCGVEEKLIPRIEFLIGAGFSPRDSRAMVRRFPQLFCYSIEGNLEPKFDFFAMEMKRDLRDLRRFPQYFSFSLNDRIRPRHWMCKDRGVLLPLPALLKPGNDEFMARLEVCVGSTPPLRTSPLWREESRTLMTDTQ